MISTKGNEMVKMFILIFMLLGGCTSARISQSISSGLIGCPAKEIKITEEKASMSGIHDWIAECNGKKYACNYLHEGPSNCSEIKGKNLSDL